jgi:hypothetical protein
LVVALAIGQASAWTPIVASSPPAARLDFACWKPAPPAAPIPILGIPINDPVPVYRPPPMYYAVPVRACVTCGRGR